MLPLEWVDRLFHKFALVYGVHIARQYTGLDPLEVKQEWARCLGGFRENTEAIKFALENLPSDRCPTMLQFRDLCRQAPKPNMLGLDAPKADTAVVDKEMAKIVREAFKVTDPLGWAKSLKERHDAGERLSSLQIKSYQEALHDTISAND